MPATAGFLRPEPFFDREDDLSQHKRAVYAIFAIGGFSPDLYATAQSVPDEVWLIDQTSLLPNTSIASASTTAIYPNT